MAMRLPRQAFSTLRGNSPFMRPLAGLPACVNTSSFHTSRPSLLVIGEKIPPHTVMEKGPKDRVDLQKEIGSTKTLIIGVPAAFSGTCTKEHLPGFIKSLSQIKDKGFHNVFVISVNDPFVVNAWKEHLGVSDNSVRFFADPQAEWAKAARVDFDATTIMGNRRSKRFVATVEDGVVSGVFIEPDNTGLTITSAPSILASI